MVRCPNCNGTTQVRLIKEYWSKMSQSSHKHYNCGCGCIFKIEKMTNGITNGTWQVVEKGSE